MSLKFGALFQMPLRVKRLLF